jgi:hypothetical protein
MFSSYNYREYLMPDSDQATTACPTSRYVYKCCYICVLMLLCMCPHTDIYVYFSLAQWLVDQLKNKMAPGEWELRVASPMTGSRCVV